MGLTFGRITHAFMENVPARRMFKLGGENLFAETGITSKGLKYTKLYSKDGDLVSWKHSLNGKIRKGRYEKVDIFDRDKGLKVELNGNKKLTTVRFDGSEVPQRKTNLFDDGIFDPLTKKDPYNSSLYDDIGLNSDPLTNPWDKSPWSL